MQVELGADREFVYNYGDAQLARELWRDRARSAADPRYFAHPMLKRVVESARMVIVHNPAAAEVAQRHGAKHVVEIPHLYFHPIEAPAPRPSGRRRGTLRESEWAGAGKGNRILVFSLEG